MKTPHPPTGYAVELGEGLAAAVHLDGALTLESEQGAAELSPAQVEQLRELLRLAGGILGQARRRRAQAAYGTRYEGR